MKAHFNENGGASFETDGSPKEMIMTVFSPEIYTSNSRKRVDVIQRLASRISADVYFPFAHGTDITIEISNESYECQSYRQTEKALRWLARQRREAI